VAECLEIAVVTQGPTLDDTIENLREAVALHLDGEDPAAFGLRENPTLLVTIVEPRDGSPEREIGRPERRWPLPPFLITEQGD